jgi:WD40 repeat protein
LADGRLASGGDDGKIRLWQKDFKGEPEVLLHGGLVGSLTVLSDGRLASGSADGLRLWPKSFKSEPETFSHGDRVHTLTTLPDGRLASAGEDGQIKLWLVDEMKLIAALCLRAGRNLSGDEWTRFIGPDTPRQPSCSAFGLPSNWR